MGSHKKRSAPGRGLWALYLSDGLTALLLTLGGAFAFFSVCGVDWPRWLPAAVGAMALADFAAMLREEVDTKTIQ